MASLIRPQMLRTATRAAGNSRCATKTSPITTSILKSTTQSRTTTPSFVRDSLPGAVRVSAFHASARRPILPPLPERLEGTANEAAPVPPPSPSHGAYHWVFERAVSVLLIPVTVAPFVGGSLNPVMDAAFCGLLVLHTHVGFQSVITDYLPPKRVPKTRALFDWGLLAGSGVVAWGLWEFETNDVGLTEAVKKLWRA